MKRFLLIGAVLLGVLARMPAREIPAANPEELEHAIQEAAPGDVIVMADGTWPDVKIKFFSQGTAEQPVTLRAQTPGRVILSGQSSLAIGGEYLVADGLLFRDGFIDSGHVIAFRAGSDKHARHCRLTNTAIIDYNIPDNQGKSSNWVSLFGQNNRVDHCYFRGKNTKSPLLTVWLNGEPNNHQIDNNYFGAIPLLGENGGETMRVGDSKTSMQNSRTIVERNYFEDCDGEVEIISNKSCENIYRHNTFFRNAGTLTLRHGNRCLVEGNYFFGAGKANAGGVRIIGEEHRVLNNYFADLTGEKFFSAIGFMACLENSALSGYFQIKKAVVAFNTVVHCKNSIFIGIGFGSRDRKLPPEDSTIANNVILGEGAPLVTELVAPVRMTWKGNIFYGADPGLPQNDGFRVEDPRLAQGSDGLWQPAADSPVAGAAAGNFPDVTSDILGRERGARKDAGCFQISSQAPMRYPPLAAADVGPEWVKK